MAGQFTTPTIWVGPVRSHCPATSSSFCCAVAPPANKTVAAAAVTIFDKLVITAPPLAVVLALIGKWPYSEVISDVAPQAVEPLRLDDQEEDNQTAEQDQPK